MPAATPQHTAHPAPPRSLAAQQRHAPPAPHNLQRTPKTHHHLSRHAASVRGQQRLARQPPLPLLPPAHTPCCALPTPRTQAPLHAQPALHRLQLCWRPPPPPPRAPAPLTPPVRPPQLLPMQQQRLPPWLSVMRRRGRPRLELPPSAVQLQPRLPCARAPVARASPVPSVSPPAKFAPGHA